MKRMFKKALSIVAFFVFSIWVFICLTIGGGTIMASCFDISFGWGITASIATIIGTFCSMFLN